MSGWSSPGISRGEPPGNNGDLPAEILAVPGDAFDVEDVAGNEALDEVIGGLVAETI